MIFCRTGFHCSFYVLIFHPFFTIIIKLFSRTCIFTGFEFPLFSRNFLCILSILHRPTKLLGGSHLNLFKKASTEIQIQILVGNLQIFWVLIKTLQYFKPYVYYKIFTLLSLAWLTKLLLHTVRAGG